MNRNADFPKLLLTIAVGLIAATPAWAESLEPAEVAADAKWLIHLNVDEIRYTALAQEIQQKLLQADENQGRLDWVQDKLGINLRSDLHGLTFYGKSYAPHEGVGVVHAEYDRGKLVAAVEKKPQHKAAEYRDYTIHEWQVEQGGKHHNLALALHDEGTIVVSGSIEQAQSALDVLDSRRDSLKKKPDSPLLGKVPGGTFFRGSAIDLQDLETRNPQDRKNGNQAFPALGQAKEFSVSFAEKGPNLELGARLVAASEDAAQKVAQFLQAFTQASSNQKTNGSKFGQLLKQFDVKRDGATVSIDGKIDRETLVDFLKESAIKKKKTAEPSQSPQPPATPNGTER